MSDNDPDGETTTDSQQESEQEPADSDQPAAQSDEQSTDQTDESTEETQEQPAEDEQPADQAEDQATDTDQPSGESEEQPTDSDQPTEQSEEQSVEGDQLVAQADEQPATGDEAAGQASTEPELSPAPKRPYGVESWRPLVTEMAGDIPVEVLLRWIKHESGGNPCSTGAPAKTGGGSIENGIFQLYSPDDDHLATPAQLHGSFCSGQTCTRDLTLDEARIQVASGIAYVRICRDRARAQLKQAGVTWDEAGTDFWSLVKMQHNLPSVPKQYIPKLRPSSWSEFKQGVLKAQPNYAKTTIFTNAEDIGAAA
jgi:exosome complex component RRP41